jgi:nucleotide-binding universal stress UspA family protein
VIDQSWPVAPPRKILLATDLSSRGDRALDRAAQLARQWGAQLLIVHAIEPAPPGSTWREFEEAPSWRRPPDARTAIERQIRRDLREDVANLTVLIEEGAAVQVILDAVEREGCDLVILGAARDELFGGVLLGNTIEHLVRRSPVSVLVVKTRPGGAYRHILVGTDFTEESRHGLSVAATLFPDAIFTLMHAFEMPYRALLLNNQLSHDFAAMEMATIEAFLKEADLAEDVRARVHTTIEHGPPEAMLRSYVVEQDADLTVIGAFGRGLMFHVLIGGTARRIVDAVPSDVLVVRARREG